MHWASKLMFCEYTKRTWRCFGRQLISNTKLRSLGLLALWKYSAFTSYYSIEQIQNNSNTRTYDQHTQRWRYSKWFDKQKLNRSFALRIYGSWRCMLNSYYEKVNNRSRLFFHEWSRGMHAASLVNSEMCTVIAAVRSIAQNILSIFSNWLNFNRLTEKSQTI